MKLKFKGLWIIVAGLIFAVIQTAYFGWNWSAASTPELICDWIAGISYVIGAVVFWVENGKSIFQIQ